MEDAKQLYEHLTDDKKELEPSMLQELSDCEAESIKGGGILYPYIVRFDSPRTASSDVTPIEEIGVVSLSPYAG